MEPKVESNSANEAAAEWVKHPKLVVAVQARYQTERWADSESVASASAAAKAEEVQRQGPAALGATTTVASLDSASLAAGLRGAAHLAGCPAVVGAMVVDHAVAVLPIVVGPVTKWMAVATAEEVTKVTGTLAAVVGRWGCQ